MPRRAAMLHSPACLPGVLPALCGSGWTPALQQPSPALLAAAPGGFLQAGALPMAAFQAPPGLPMALPSADHIWWHRVPRDAGIGFGIRTDPSLGGTMTFLEKQQQRGEGKVKSRRPL